MGVAARARNVSPVFSVFLTYDCVPLLPIMAMPSEPPKWVMLVRSKPPPGVPLYVSSNWE